MKYLFLLLAFSLFSISSFSADEYGFIKGDRYDVVKLSGEVKVICPNVAQEYQCSRKLLAPDTYSRFYNNSGIDADKVSLTTLHEDGSQVTRRANFNRTTGKTKYRFNLWVKYLAQKPLLELGVNNVKYKLSKNGMTVDEDGFIVIVRESESRKCQKGVLYYLKDYKCEQELACLDYFASQNFCK